MATLSITKGYADNTSLFESDITAFKTALETFFNETKLSDDNIQDAGISLVKLSLSAFADETSITVGDDGLEVKDGGVSTAALNDNAISTVKILDGAVTGAKIANNSVTTAKIADDAVDTSALASNSVDTSELASNAVTTAKLVDNTVVASNLSETDDERDWVLDRIANITINTVGSMRYAFCRLSLTYNPGTIFSGSNLGVETSGSWDVFQSLGDGSYGSTLSGTWMYIGANPITEDNAGLFLRLT
jgi:hypothetical protein